MRRVLYIILSLMLVTAIGCGKKGGSKSGGANNTPTTPTVPPVTPPVTPPAGSGVTVDFTASKAMLDTYLGWTTNIPTETKITINLTKYGTYAKPGGGTDSGFGGYIDISFKDGTATYSDRFSSLAPGGGTVTSNEVNHRYNLVTTDYPEMAGKIGYHGFFESSRQSPSNTRFQFQLGTVNGYYGYWCMDMAYYQPVNVSYCGAGAIIVVIDSSNDLGDGQGPTSANGRIYFKNFGSTAYPSSPHGGIAPISPTNCWFVSAGPYDCRTWKSGNSLNTKASIYPTTSDFAELGRFVNLNMKNAFSGL